MAELLCCGRPPEHQRTHRHQLWHGSHRGALCPLRCASGPRVSGWARADRAALLHELGVTRLQAEEVSAKKETMERRASSPGHHCGERARRPSLHRSYVLIELQLREI